MKNEKYWQLRVSPDIKKWQLEVSPDEKQKELAIRAEPR